MTSLTVYFLLELSALYFRALVFMMQATYSTPHKESKLFSYKIWTNLHKASYILNHSQIIISMSRVCMPSHFSPMSGMESKTDIRTKEICSVLIVVQSLSRVTPKSIAHQAPLSMGFSRQEHWSGLPCPPPGIFLNQGSNPCPLHCRQSLPLSHQRRSIVNSIYQNLIFLDNQTIPTVGNTTKSKTVIMCRNLPLDDVVWPLRLHSF